jgi:hypothetical protein
MTSPVVVSIAQVIQEQRRNKMIMPAAIPMRAFSAYAFRFWLPH